MPQQCVLVAEDEMIIGVDLCDTVEEAGYEVAGPYDTASSAIDSLDHRTPDLAILDVRLDDGEVFPLAEKLIAANVPVIFHSGEVSPGEVSGRYPHALALAKPCPPNQIIETMREALAAA
jgi:DNA-binding response OmpR family regulator